MVVQQQIKDDPFVPVKSPVVFSPWFREFHPELRRLLFSDILVRFL